MKGFLKLLGLFFFMVSCVCYPTFFKLTAESHTEEKGAVSRKRVSNSYFRNWLEQDVAYIITDGERAVFEHLNTNEERQQFVDLFWLRRDPTPDNYEKEFQEEHYRRLTYANENFTPPVPGWKTDRGRIYIVMGPPDQIERRSNAKPAAEIWSYRKVPDCSWGREACLEFIDFNQSGNYKLEMNSDTEALLDRLKVANITEGGRFTVCDWPREYRYVGGIRTPQTRFKDLEACLTNKVQFNLLTFKYELKFKRITGATIMTTITIRVQNKDLASQRDTGKLRASVRILGRIRSAIGTFGRVVDSFDGEKESETASDLLSEEMKGTTTWQTMLPLKAGSYKLELALQDPGSKNIGTSYSLIVVPKH
ncbi:MAG: GWxTD domain-containing protein [Acidobacteriia bacterium]|nr:GWxTD domain-containing protein [Terriglobia bacterium]